MKSITKKPDFQASDVYDITTVTGIGDYSESPDHTRYIYKKSDQDIVIRSFSFIFGERRVKK